MAGNHKKRRVQRAIVYPSWRSALPALLFAALVASLVRVMCDAISLGAVQLHLPFSDWQSRIELSLPPLVFLVLIARPIGRVFDSVVVIGRHHVYAQRGRFSLNRRRTEVAFEDMRGVRTDQNFLERLLNVGTVRVWTADLDQSAITMQGVSDPDRITNELRHRIDHARLKRPHADVGQDMEIQHRAA